MAQKKLASAIALPSPESGDNDGDDARTRAGMKRAAEDGGEQESKRLRTSPGKDSPQPLDDGQQDSPNARHEGLEIVPAQAEHAKVQERRKSRPVDEKQRSKRLFGALLGNLNQPRDRTSTKRLEIESRRKAELQRQDDERIEDRQKRLEELIQQRKREQKRVDRDNMRIRHRNILDRANFLQTEAEPVLLYQPWTLRTSEEDRIQDQLDEAQTQIDREVTEFESKIDDSETILASDDDNRTTAEDTAPNHSKEPADGEMDASNGASAEIVETQQEPGALESGDDTAMSGENTAEQPKHSTEQLEKETGGMRPEEPTKVALDDNHNGEDHVEEGDEDTVIY